MWNSPTFAWMGEGEEAVRRAERAIGLSPDAPLIFRCEHVLSIAHDASEHHEAAVDWGMRSLRSAGRRKPGRWCGLRNSWGLLWASGAPDQGADAPVPQPGYGALSAQHVEQNVWEIFSPAP